MSTARKVDLRKSVVLSERTFIAHSNGVNTGNGFTFGPVLVTIRIVIVDGCKATADGWHAASYYVSIDGAHQFGGRTNGLEADGMPKGASFLVFGTEITSTPDSPDSTPDSTPTSVETMNRDQLLGFIVENTISTPSSDRHRSINGRFVDLLADTVDLRTFAASIDIW